MKELSPPSTFPVQFYLPQNPKTPKPQNPKIELSLCIILKEAFTLKWSLNFFWGFALIELFSVSS